MKEQTLARFLANFSLGLGFAELLAPRQVARLAGINDGNDMLIRACGLREIASGLGIMQGKPGVFLWSRVGGDVVDLALLGAAMRNPNNDRRRLNIALAAVAGVTVLDVVASILASRDHSEPGWRIQNADAYAAGIDRADPAELRACCDDAMAEQSGHVFRDEDNADFARPATLGSLNDLDQLAGNDDGLEQTEPADRPTTQVPGM